MNQTKKRLSIINLAISINDIETIQLQVLKLSLLKTETEIQEILEILQAKNYAQAQGFITAYLKRPSEGVVQRSVQEPSISLEDQAIIDEFDLFVIPKKTKKKKKKLRRIEAVDVDSFLDVTVDNVLTQDSHIPQEKFFEKEATQTNFMETTDIPKDTFFDNIQTEEIAPTEKTKEIFVEEEIIEVAKKDKKKIKKVVAEEKEEIRNEQEEVYTEHHTESILDNSIPSEHQERQDTEEKMLKEPLSSDYPPILHLEQKIISMKNLYPAIEQRYEQFSTVETLMYKLIHEYYAEKEIEETLAYAIKLIEQESILEATQLILVCAGTESKFAQFILARELYKGTIFQKNTSEAFSIIQSLAINDYPEALCDLGQFYEYGIGTAKNKKKAEELYKGSMELGIYRAKTHYERLKKENRSFFRR